MKRFTTILCSVCFMMCGAFLALSQQDLQPPGANTAQAAPTVLPVLNKLPLEVQLSSDKRQTDTVMIHDTVQVTNTVYKRVPKLKCITDTLVLPMLMPGPPVPLPVSYLSGDREEYTPVLMQSPKQSIIRLTVDGKVVYETENDIHSTESSP